MSKQPITWIELINKKISERKAKGLAAGVGDVTGEAKAEWDKIKAGTHDKFVKGKATRKAKKGKKKKARKSKKVKPGHKGAPSKTRPGRLDFRTHKGDKFYNRDGHRQDENVEGVKGRPYEHRRETPTLAELARRVEKLEKKLGGLKGRDAAGSTRKRKRSKRGVRKAAKGRATKRARKGRSPKGSPMSIDTEEDKSEPMSVDSPDDSRMDISEE